MTVSEPQDPASEPSSGPRHVAASDASLLDRHADLVALDNVIGLEATVARLTFDLTRARRRIQDLKKQVQERDAELEAVRRSRTWRVGRVFTGPFSRLRR